MVIAIKRLVIVIMVIIDFTKPNDVSDDDACGEVFKNQDRKAEMEKGVL